MALQRHIRAFARQRLGSEPAAAFDRDRFASCAEQGLTGLLVASEHGGAGLGPLDAALAYEAFGAGCPDAGLLLSLGAHAFAVTQPLARFGSAAQKAEYLGDLATGARVGAFAMSEPGAGSDVASLATRAEPDGNGWRLKGSKTWITNAEVAELLCVIAVTDADKGTAGGLTAFLVRRDDPGLHFDRVGELLGHASSGMGGFTLDGVRVPAERVLGGVGGGMAIFHEAMDHERVGIFAGHLGAMQRMLDDVIEHVKTRRTRVGPLSAQQAVAHRIADLKTRLEAARWLVYRAASRLGKSRQVGLDAAIAKLYVSEALVECARDYLVLSGAAGYTADHAAARAIADAVGTTLYSGTSDIQRNIIASWLGL